MWNYISGNIKITEATDLFPSHVIGHALAKEMYRLKDVHTRLSEFLEGKIDKRQKELFIRFKSTTDREHFINKELSIYGCYRKKGEKPDIMFPYEKYNISRHYMRGYSAALGGYDPYLDEIRAPDDTFSEIKMKGRGIDNEINEDLYYYINGYYDSVLDRYLLNLYMDAPKITTPQKLELKSIFNPGNNSFEVCKGLLEDLEITIDGITNIKKGKVGKLTGLITAIKNTPNMLKLDLATDQQLLAYFNSYLNTAYKTFSKRNEDFTESLDASKRYIKQYFKK